MAAEPNMGYHQEATSLGSGPGSSNSQTTTAEMIAVPSYFSHSGSSSLVFSGTPSVMSENSNQGGSHLLDTMPGLQHDTGLATEWTLEEQYKLEEGLIKYANEPSIMKYIKIAAVLQDKTVRDVALRCKWMTRKRRKQEDYSLGKRVKDRKDKMPESSYKGILSTSSPMNVSHSLSMSNHEKIICMPSGALIGATRHLLEENNQALCQISANLLTLKLQENVELFFRTRNNITMILNDMRNVPGVMSQMPPLPVFMNDALVKILQSSSQDLTTKRIFGRGHEFGGLYICWIQRCVELLHV